jgi:hypothetical protein
MQRVSLIRHNLHAALRTDDFAFFKTIQAQAFLEGTDYVAIVSLMHDDADSILHAIEDLNLSLAYVYQDAFKSVYDSVRNSSADKNPRSRHAIVKVDISQQKQIVDIAVDKIVSSVSTLIEQQPESVRDVVASAWIVGVTVIADALQVCSLSFVKLEHLDRLDDFIHLEYSWQDVQTAVEGSVNALRGALHLMSTSSSPDSRQKDVESGSRRSSSISSASSWIRRLSTAISNGVGASNPPSRRNSLSVPNHDSLSAVCPSVKRGAAIPPHNLETIPPTPGYLQDQHSAEVNPFELGFTG